MKSLHGGPERPLSETEIQISFETSKSWRWQSHGMPAEDSYQQGVEPGQEREVCALQLDKLKGRSHPSSLPSDRI